MTFGYTGCKATPTEMPQSLILRAELLLWPNYLTASLDSSLHCDAFDWTKEPVGCAVSPFCRTKRKPYTLNNGVTRIIVAAITVNGVSCLLIARLLSERPPGRFAAGTIPGFRFTPRHILGILTGYSVLYGSIVPSVFWLTR
jgi:hypothetical protein